MAKFNSDKTVFSLFITFLLIPGVLTGQEQKPVEKDTTLNAVKIFHLPSLFYALTEVGGQSGESIHSPVPGFLSLELDVPSHYDSWSRDESIDLDAPWKLHLREEKKNATWRGILGSVQAGGAAYILYRHIKKYGLK